MLFRSREVKVRARAGVAVLGICNGLQMLTEAGLLPGALMRNASLKFVCRNIHLKVEACGLAFTRGYAQDAVISTPVAHHDGNYFADEATLDRLEGEGRVAFRYCDAAGNPDERANPNGSLEHIAGVCNLEGNVVGIMPHPERSCEMDMGSEDGLKLFTSALTAATS